MAHRNVHQGKKSSMHKAAIASKTNAQSPTVKQPVAANPVRAYGVKTPTSHESTAVRFAELPYELRRIALFSAFVVVLLLVLWFFLK